MSPCDTRRAQQCQRGACGAMIFCARGRQHTSAVTHGTSATSATTAAALIAACTRLICFFLARARLRRLCRLSHVHTTAHHQRTLSQRAQLANLAKAVQCAVSPTRRAYIVSRSPALPTVSSAPGDEMLSFDGCPTCEMNAKCNEVLACLLDKPGCLRHPWRPPWRPCSGQKTGCGRRLPQLKNCDGRLTANASVFMIATTSLR